MFVDSFISLIKQKDMGNFKKPLKGHYNRNHSTVEMSPLISLYFCFHGSRLSCNFVKCPRLDIGCFFTFLIIFVIFLFLCLLNHLYLSCVYTYETI